LFYESGLFSDFVIHRGMENIQDRVVARYEPGAIVGFDLDGFLRGRETIPNPMLQPTAYPQKPSQSVDNR
jgi:hypothetical protein